MKKLCAILMAALVLLMATGAMADTSTVARSGALAAYLDGAGGLYVPGNSAPMNKAQADALVAIDPYCILFLSNRTDGDSDLYMIDLTDFSESLLASGVYAARMDGEDLYYVPSADRTQLMRMDRETGASALAYTAAEPIDRLQLTAEGLALELVDGAGAVLHVNQTGSFEPYLNDVPRHSELTESYEFYLSGSDLYLRDTANYTAEYIDSGVQDFAVMNDVVYYVANVGGSVQLKSYAPATTSWQTVMNLEVSMERQLTATGNSLFMIDLSRQIYSVDLGRKQLTPFAKVPGDSNYTVPAGFDIARLRLEGMEGQLNVYAELEEASAQPDFSFIEFTSASDALEPKKQLLETYAIDGEAAAWTALKPAAQYSPLSRGSRGEAVSAIQQPLYDLGYYDYYIDGIFGPRTEAAVRMVQADLSRTVTGIADSELQRMLLEGRVPHYDAFMALTRGNRGLRVQVMQERLRELGYLADAADGIFGANTQRAVQLFQSENGLSVSDGATRETLKALYADNAPACSSYIDLYPGNTGIRVRALNARLRDLYYLSSNPGSVYTRQTAEAVRSYQRTAGLRVTGIATAEVQRRLFSRYAPEAAGYIVLSRGDDNDRVEALQRRLKELGYYTGSVDGYFGRSTEKAVKLFQRAVGLNPSGVATVRTQELLFRKDAPEYVKPTVISDPVIGLDRYHHYDKGVYYIADGSTDTGYVTFSWYVEGEAESYRVRIRDEKKRTYVDEDTYLSRTGVSLYTLEYDRVYTLTVTAYPVDGDSKHITSSSLSFVRIEDPVEPVEPEPAVIGEPEIALSTVTRIQDGIHYVAPGQVKLQWHAEGEVDSYNLEVLDSDGDTWLSKSTKDENISFKSDSMEVGQVYTLLVYAIPRHGTLDDATTAAEFFALEDVSVPTPSPEPENWDELTVEEIEEVEPKSDEPEEEAPSDEPQDEEVPEDEPRNEEVTPEEIPEEEPPVEESQDEEPLPKDAPTPTPEPAEEVAPEAPVITLAPDGDVQPKVESEAAAPELSFNTVMKVDEETGITYLADDTIELNWHSDGNVGSYYAEIRDQDGNPLAHATTDKGTLSIKKGNFQPGQVYTLVVTAIPEGGSVEDGVAATAQLALYSDPDAEKAPEHEEVTEEADEVVDEAPVAEIAEEVVEASDEEPEQEVEPEQEEAEVEAPAVEISDEASEDTSEEDSEETSKDYSEDYSEDDSEGSSGESYDEEELPDEEVYAGKDVEEESSDDPWSQALTADSDSGLISQLQNRLVSWGWLEGGSFESGALDAATLQAVRDFQSYYNENHGGELALSESSISPATLNLLMNSDESYTR